MLSYTIFVKTDISPSLEYMMNGKSRKSEFFNIIIAFTVNFDIIQNYKINFDYIQYNVTWSS